MAEESKSQAVVVPQSNPKQTKKLPTFRSVINVQTVDGNWPSEARSVLNSCLTDSENFEDADVIEALGMIDLQEGADS